MKQTNRTVKPLLFRLLSFLFLVHLIASKAIGQVHLQTGSAAFSLPLFEWQDHKSRLNASIALNYSSGSGLKVSDVASNVGQGWSLLAGGVITRQQLGEPDDQFAYGLEAESHLAKFPPGYLFATEPTAKGCPDALTRYPLYGARNQLYAQHNKVAEDKQLDFFSFQFNDKVGLFVLNRDTRKGELLGDSRIKISYELDENNYLRSQYLARTRIRSFTIQDEDGLLYTFSVLALTRVMEVKYCDKNQVKEQRQPEFKNGKVYYQTGYELPITQYPYVVNSWYLSEVKDPFTGRTIRYNYTERTQKNEAGTDISYNSTGDYSLVYFKRSSTKTPDLTSIVYPDGHSVHFNYGRERVDLKGAYALASVDVTYNQAGIGVSQVRTLSKYLLNTTYFILNRYGTPSSTFQKKAARLCLKSVKKIGVDLKEDTPPYEFDYYLGSSEEDDFVPPPFFPFKDIWGYYNGKETRDFYNVPIPLTKPLNQWWNSETMGLCFLRNGTTGTLINPKANMARNGLLRQITYPTGGTLRYEYAQNSGKLNPGNPGEVDRIVGGVHVAKISTSDGSLDGDCNNTLSTEYRYVLEGGATASSLWGLEPPQNTLEVSSYYKPESQRFHWRPSCLLGCCYYKFMYPGILSQQQAIDLNGFQKFMEAAAPALGVLSVVSTVMDVAAVLAAAPTPWAIVAVVIDAVAAVVNLAVTCLHDYSRNTQATIYQSMDLNSISPLPAQFKRVEVVENPATIGKTVHLFTSSDQYPVWESTNPALSAAQRFGPWLYGLPKLVTVYNQAGQKVKEVENVYDDQYAKRLIAEEFFKNGYDPLQSNVYSKVVSCKCLPTASTSQKSTDWVDPQKYNATYISATGPRMKVKFYGYYTGRMLLERTYERVYQQGDDTRFAETRTDYQYNYDKNYAVHTQSTRTGTGDIYYTFYRYNSDYSGGVLGALDGQNITDQPIETVKAMVQAGSNTGMQYLSTQVSELSQLANGDVKPVRLLERRFAQPVQDFPGYQGPGSDVSQFSVVQNLTYDGEGKLTGLQDEGQRTISNIYDHDGKYVVASLINALPGTSAYSSFETGSLGGWSLSGTPSYNTNGPALTGKSSFYLGGGNSLTAYSLDGSKAYRLTLWVRNGTVSVSGNASLVKSGPTRHEFTYHEYELPAGSGPVTLSGTATIDELRLYPQNARVRTVSYDPLLGKTAECDENNRLSYYEYDNLGRLRLVKDEEGNIVKMYEYNTATRPDDCRGIFSNLLIRELFFRTAPDSTWQGGAIAYTIPAGKYTSTISQEDADAKAESELAELGQTTAETGGSLQKLYGNDVLSQSFPCETCPDGYKGGLVTYTVPAGRYTALAKAKADSLAAEDLAANGWANANDPANATCSVDTEPHWEWLDGAPTYCYTVNGQLPAHLFVRATDTNPNSPSYNNTEWKDAGPQGTCPAGTYFSSAQSRVFTKSNCPSGYVGNTVTYTVPTGKYSSTLSQAAADQLALNDRDNNGQAYADSAGTCTAAPHVYARVSHENVYGDGYGNSYGDVVVRFYSDAAGTNPVSVSNLTLQYTHEDYCQNFLYHLNTTASGYAITLADDVVLSYMVQMCQDQGYGNEQCEWGLCFNDFFLSTGTGYTIIY